MNAVSDRRFGCVRLGRWPSQQRLDPVQWTLTSTRRSRQAGLHRSAAPDRQDRAGLASVFADHPQASASRPRSRLTDNPAVESFTVYQPQPVRTIDPNFKVRRRDVLEPGRVLDPGDAQEGRHGASRADRAGPLSGLQRQAVPASEDEDGRVQADGGRVRAGHRGVHGSGGIHRSETRRAGRCGGSSTAARNRRACAAQQGLAAFAAHGLRLRPRGDLHALRFPDDPHHGLVFPEPARRDSCRRWCFRSGSSFCSARWDWASPRWPDRSASRSWRESLGERIHRAGVRRLRAQLAGSVRDHPALGPADQARQRFAARRLLRHAADGADVFADLVRLRGTVCGTAAGGVGADARARSRCSEWSRFATGLASPFFFLAAFPSYLKKLPKSGGWLVRVKVVMGFVLLAVDAQVPEQHRSGAADRIC